MAKNKKNNKTDSTQAEEVLVSESEDEINNYAGGKSSKGTSVPDVHSQDNKSGKINRIGIIKFIIKEIMHFGMWCFYFVFFVISIIREWWTDTR